MKTWLEVYPEFKDLKEFFESQIGYVVKVVQEENYDFVEIRGNDIRAGFCTPNQDSYYVLQGRFVADNERCFNKWSQAPLIMEIPLDKEKLMEALKFLGSEEGYEYSNGFNYLDDDWAKLPHEISYD